jgi:hypothetical protein
MECACFDSRAIAFSPEHPTPGAPLVLVGYPSGRFVSADPPLTTDTSLSGPHLLLLILAALAVVSFLAVVLSRRT